MAALSFMWFALSTGGNSGLAGGHMTSTTKRNQQEYNSRPTLIANNNFRITYIYINTVKRGNTHLLAKPLSMTRTLTIMCTEGGTITNNAFNILNTGHRSPASHRQPAHPAPINQTGES